MSEAVNERKIFRLRCPNGENAGLYLVSADFDEGIVWTDRIEDAPAFTMVNAYSYVASLIDVCRECVMPERTGDATEEECREFGRMAANDMFQTPGENMVKWFEERAVRRSPDVPLFEVPDMPARSDPSYMSIWEWVGRCFYRPDLAEAVA